MFLLDPPVYFVKTNFFGLTIATFFLIFAVSPRKILTIESFSLPSVVSPRKILTVESFIMKIKVRIFSCLTIYNVVI